MWLLLIPSCGLFSIPAIRWSYLGCFYNIPVPRSTSWRVWLNGPGFGLPLVFFFFKAPQVILICSFCWASLHIRGIGVVIDVSTMVLLWRQKYASLRCRIQSIERLHLGIWGDQSGMKLHFRHLRDCWGLGCFFSQSRHCTTSGIFYYFLQHLRIDLQLWTVLSPFFHCLFFFFSEKVAERERVRERDT